MCQKHSKPIIWREGSYKYAEIENFQKENRVWRVADVYPFQREELWEINNPGEKNAQKFASEPEKGDWLYFPWSGALTRAIPEKDYQALRTNRNRNLITAEEQKKLKEFPIGIVGLSIGSAFLTSLAYSGFHSFKLAEFDKLSATNLNRIRARVDQVGQPKIEIAAEQVYEINPYAELSLFCSGLKKDSLTDFLGGQLRPKLIFEAVDDFEMKIRLRLAAREAGIPVIMFSNLGDSALIDVERYDLDKKPPLFNGRLGDLPEKILENPALTMEEKNKYAVQIVGMENVPQRAMESVMEIGKTLVGRPQLVSTVTVSGGAAAYLARRVALGEPLPSGRKLVKFEDAFLI